MSSDGRMVFVGNLPLDIRERELDDLFYKYGKIMRIDLKTPARPPAYAFIEYDDSRDALDAVRFRDGHDFYNYKLRVEIAHGGTRSSRGGGGDRGDRGGRDGGGGGRQYESNMDMYGGGGGGGGGRRSRSGRGPPAHYFGPTHRSDFRVIVTNLPGSCSWQDLKDHMRKGGEVTFAQVFKERNGMMGVVDYATFDEMKAAIRKLDDSVFENPFDKCYIRVKEEKRRSMSRSRSRSRSRSPRRSVSRSRSRSPVDRSPERKRAGTGSPRRSYSPRPRSGSPYNRRSGSPKRRSGSPKRSPPPVRRSSSPRDREADVNGDAGRARDEGERRRDIDGDDTMGRQEDERTEERRD
eukprot:TRINITY_DN5339_c0_g1_i1.p1 TRINITY_DN5339_c0_g1~~TRINITY_DN5339_c0_g1_i1.p1  ORF type:complete len:351 (+),score=81.14 TRINITY_DN5339_c0_g1_i1:415-1467(+)